MSKIDVQIPRQGFEVVRDRIGEILADELYNQLLMSGNYLFDLRVWVERFVAIDKTEVPCINVVYSNTDYSGSPVINNNGANEYYIDCYARAVTTDDERADQAAMIKLQRLMGVCRYILTDPKYVTMGYAIGTGYSPFIKRRYIKKMIIDEPGQYDATSSVRGRIVFAVEFNETYSLITPPPLTDKSTILKLNETDKGYYYA
jgi:hypothetical protein